MWLTERSLSPALRPRTPDVVAAGLECIAWLTSFYEPNEIRKHPELVLYPG